MAKISFWPTVNCYFSFIIKTVFRHNIFFFYVNIVVVWELSLGMKAMLQNLNIQNADVG